MKSIVNFLKFIFTKAPSCHEVKPEDWYVDDNWENWHLTKVTVPLLVHRHRACKFDWLGQREWRLARDYDEDGTLIIRYERSNYPMEPRQAFRIDFV